MDDAEVAPNEEEEEDTADLTPFYWYKFKLMFHRRNHLKVEN